MSTAETTAELPPPPTPEDLPWKEELLQQWMQARLAHEGMMLDKIQQQNKRVLELADAARTGTIGKESAASTEGDDMGVSIGNKEYHYHYENAQQANSTTTEASPVAKASSTLAKAAAAAALVGAGGIGVVGVNMAIDALTRPDPSPVIVQPATDTDTNAGLRFKD